MNTVGLKLNIKCRPIQAGRMGTCPFDTADPCDPIKKKKNTAVPTYLTEVKVMKHILVKKQAYQINDHFHLIESIRLRTWMLPE